MLFYCLGNTHHIINLKPFFSDRELEKNDACKQCLILGSYSEYKVAKKRYSIFDSVEAFFPHSRKLEISNFSLLPISTYMSWEINLWEKTCKLEPNLFRSSSICLSLSLESISSIDYLSNIPNISLWDWFNEATHTWPQPEETEWRCTRYEQRKLERPLW